MAATVAEPIARAAAELGQFLTRAEADIVQGFTDRYRSIFDADANANANANSPDHGTDTDSLARALTPNTRRLFNDAAVSQASSPRAATDLQALCRMWHVDPVTLAAEFGAGRNKKFWQHLRGVARLLPSWPASLAALAAARAARRTMPRVSRTARWVDTDLRLCMAKQQQGQEQEQQQGQEQEQQQQNEQQNQDQDQGAGGDEAGQEAANNGDAIIIGSQQPQQPQQPRPNMANIAVPRVAGSGLASSPLRKACCFDLSPPSLFPWDYRQDVSLADTKTSTDNTDRRPLPFPIPFQFHLDPDSGQDQPEDDRY